ncbi:GntR family transcriptional regulator [Variovorax sp. ZS18.2.2]|uniref:FadR/GntR family transcriptional regulator n=1 Tax=Variovorax sp. ZS18.2.2 TaxID=2971255 RepID=UPI0021511EE9|nr:GntR family transcriptional regulator [Variovorax sp. ZS18.2.2]MCR6480496.1 GntR family transcriptional regulator [Variovorax sp. ZS18.2.2]
MPETLPSTAAAPWTPQRIERGNAADQIVQELRARILSGALARGARLPTEKQLASGYGVSGATVREAVRGLTTLGLIEVRHGSGAYVTARLDQLLSAPLHSVIELEQVGITEIFGVLGALNAHAAETAARHATDTEIAAMRQALEAIEEATDRDGVSEGLASFLDALALASGNPLLVVLCRFLSRIQIDIAREHSGETLKDWRRTVRKLATERARLVDAIEARTPEAASAAARAYHERALAVIGSLPRSSSVRIDDPMLARLFQTAHGRDLRAPRGPIRP